MKQKNQIEMKKHGNIWHFNVFLLLGINIYFSNVGVDAMFLQVDFLGRYVFGTCSNDRQQKVACYCFSESAA